MAIVIVLSLLVLAILLFSTNWLPFEVIGLLLLSILLLTKIITPADAFAGFGSDTVVMIAGLFVMTAALLRTGLMERIGRFIHKYAGSSPSLLAIIIMITVAGVSAFISNTAATAFFVPVVIGVARRAKISASKLLMPLAFASILTSSITLISTSTNIVVSGLLTKYGMGPLGMFELAPVGIPITIVGLVYMFTLGMKLLPDRLENKALEEAYHLRDYVTEVIVLPESPLAGKTLQQSKLGSEMDLLILGILHGKDRVIAPSPDEVIQPGDVLLVEGRAEDIIKIKDVAGLEIHADFKLPADTFETKELKLVEAMIMPGSDMRGSTLKKLHFRERFGFTVLAINRHGITLRSKITEIPLRIGDVLLMQGTEQQIKKSMAEGQLNFLGELPDAPRSPKAKYALLIFFLAIAVGTFKLLPFSSAILIGTLSMFLVGAIKPEEAYAAVEWRILILIGCMIAFGTAMEKSGTASFLSSGMVSFVGRHGPEAILAGFFILTVLLTQPMSNQAAALVLLPVAVQTATQMHLNPRSFAMMIALAASCSYLTPLEPSCVLVYGPGRYKFTDFFKVGALLTVLIFIIAMFLVPRIWPLEIGKG